MPKRRMIVKNHANGMDATQFARVQVVRDPSVSFKDLLTRCREAGLENPESTFKTVWYDTKRNLEAMRTTGWLPASLSIKCSKPS